jgi:hypothetical protein
MPAPSLRRALRTALLALLPAQLNAPALAAQPGTGLPAEVRAASALRDSGEYLRAHSAARQAAASLPPCSLTRTF